MGETVLLLCVARRRPPMVIGTFLVPYQARRVPLQLFHAVCPRRLLVCVPPASHVNGRVHIVDAALVSRVSLQVIVGVPSVGSPAVAVARVEPAIVLLVALVLQYVPVSIVALASVALKSPV